MMICGHMLQAQTNSLIQAKLYADNGETKKAKDLYEDLYKQSPNDGDVYQAYFDFLFQNKDWKAAEKLVTQQFKLKSYAPLMHIDLGRVYLKLSKEKKANEQFDYAIQSMNGDDMLATKMASTFESDSLDAWSIKTLEHGIEMMHNPFLYSIPLAKLYAKAGKMDEAVTALLNLGQIQIPGMEDTKATLLQLIGNNSQKLQLTQRALIKKINEQPDNIWYIDLLTWVYTQKNDWEGALMQIEALDARKKDSGQMLLNFARTAATEKKYVTANHALDILLEKGKEHPFYGASRAEKLKVGFASIKNNPEFKQSELDNLEKDFESYFTNFPQAFPSETLRDYATLEAQYAGNTQKAIELLEKALQESNARKDFVGNAKLQLGDYYVLIGKIWDASLLYSQVDKAFKEDMLGEEARFRNARLSYYDGDFEWAQGQLMVLKASTSELIANDALYLSVLITENIPPDSNMVPLKRFAYADLLLFQNKDKEAELLLDSISKYYPKHPLQDDIYMQLAKLNIKHKNYTTALDWLKKISDEYKQDVLADDAVFLTAQIYEQFLKQPDKAKFYYESVLVDYPGSTFGQASRSRLDELNGKKTPEP
jgi:tetratricopeptide (TPR) repeat protein